MRLLTLTTTLALSTSLLFAQNASKTTMILKEVAAINNDGSLTTKTLNTEQFLTKKEESGQLVGYFKNGQLVKMNVRLGLPSCVKTEKYYFENGELIMFYMQERAFLYNEGTKSYDVAHQTPAMEGWYYYEGGAMLKKDFKGEPKCSGQPSEQQAAEVLATAKKYAELLKK